MSSDWPIVRLGDYCLKVGSGATPRGGSKVYLEKGSTSLIRSQNVLNDGFKEEGLVFIDDTAANKLKNVIVEANDVLLNITGDSVARACLAPKKYIPARVNQHVAIIRPDPNEFDSRFIHYYLVSSSMQNYLSALAGSGGTRNALTKGMIEDLNISKPDIFIQKQVADILSSFDDKIELNRQINQTLEQMAQAIFKSWFVDFEPVKAKIEAKAGRRDPERAAMCAISGKTDDELNQLLPKQFAELQATADLFPDELVDSELGLIPKGWEVKTIIEWGTVICGKTPPKKDPSNYGGSIPFIKIPDMHGNVFATTTNDTLSLKGASTQPKKQIPKGSVCVSCIATVGQVVIASEDSHTNQQINSIVPKNMAYNSYLYFCMRERNALLHELASGGSATLNLNTGNFSKIPLPFPGDELLAKYSHKANPIFGSILMNSRQSRVLSSIRDTLLPKLLSGEIDLSENSSSE